MFGHYGARHNAVLRRRRAGRLASTRPATVPPPDRDAACYGAQMSSQAIRFALLASITLLVVGCAAANPSAPGSTAGPTAIPAPASTAEPGASTEPSEAAATSG